MTKNILPLPWSSYPFRSLSSLDPDEDEILVVRPDGQPARALFPTGGGAPSALARWNPNAVADDPATLTYVSFADAWNVIVAVGGGVIDMVTPLGTGSTLTLSGVGTLTSTVPMELRGRRNGAVGGGVSAVLLRIGDETSRLDVASLIIRDLDVYPFTTQEDPNPPSREPWLTVRESLALYGSYHDRTSNFVFIPPSTFISALYPSIRFLGNVELVLWDRSRVSNGLAEAVDDPSDSEASFVFVKQSAGTLLSDDWLTSDAATPGTIRTYGPVELFGTNNVDVPNGVMTTFSVGPRESLIFDNFLEIADSAVVIDEQPPHRRIVLTGTAPVQVDFANLFLGSIASATFEILNDTGGTVNFGIQAGVPPLDDPVLHPASATSAPDGALCIVRQVARDTWLVKVIP